MGTFWKFWRSKTAAPLNPTPLWPPIAADAAPGRVISDMALIEASGAYGKPLDAWTLPAPPPFMVAQNPKMALDLAPAGVSDVYAWASSGAFSEGMGFLGYAYLAELSQRPEYRRVSEIFAAEATRKWIKLSGKQPRIEQIEESIKRFNLRHLIRRAVELDGFFGRAQIYIDLGDDFGDPELQTPLVAAAKVSKGSLKNFKVVEPFWSYPGSYDSTNPLDPDFYRPRSWYVMQATVDASRLLTIVGREMPDMLKPAYSFGGLALSQMIKPYVDNWLRTRQSVSDLLHSFATMVLSTDMSTILTGGAAGGLIKRLQLFNQTRDNRGVFAVNKETETLENVSTPLSTIDALQAQSQEQIASVCGIPLTILLGVTPSGLNASSEGEIRSFYDNVKSYQERTLRGPLHTLLDLIQLDIDGTIDAEINFEFEPLWEMSEIEKSTIRKVDADIDVGYANIGVIDNDEVRTRITDDETSPYHGMTLKGNDELNAPPPPPMMAPGSPGGLKATMPGMKAAPPRKQANDAWIFADPHSLALIAMDEQHWITVHPHGDEEGQPVLIEGNGSGGYTIIGGAGGALNGTTVHPGSMSGATGGGHADHHEATAAAKAASNYAHGRGTSEAHEAAAHAHGVAKEYARVAGEKDKETDHGKSFAEHKQKARELDGKKEPEPKTDEETLQEQYRAAVAEQGQEKTDAALRARLAAAQKRAEMEKLHPNNSQYFGGQAELEAVEKAMKANGVSAKTDAEIALEAITKQADAETYKANEANTAEAHREAGTAHMLAAGKARVAGNADAAEYHREQQNKHTAKAEELEADVLPNMTAKADAASAHAAREKTELAHRQAAQAHSDTLKAYREAGKGQDGMNRYHYNKYAEHWKKANQLGKKAAVGGKIEQRFSSEAKATLAKRADVYKGKPVEDIKADLHSRFGLNFRDGDGAATKAYNDAYWEHSKTQAGMNDGEREESEANVNNLRNIARAASVGNVRSFTHHNMASTEAKDKKNVEASRKALGHVASALEHLESQGFDIKGVLSGLNVAYAPGSVGPYGGLSWQHNGVGHFALHPAHIDEAHLAQYSHTDAVRKEKGQPKWTVGNENPENIPMHTAIHELAHAVGMHAGVGSPQRLQGILQKLFPSSLDRKNWIKANISEYGAKDGYETDAELASLVAGPGYVRGTLPIELEEHVDRLFGRKA